MLPFLTPEMLGWIGVYILIGFIYVFLRYSENKDKIWNEIEKRNLHNHPFIEIVFPITMVVCVLTWPHLVASLIWRKCNEFRKK